MKKVFSLLLLWTAIFGILTASPNFPVLADRVVDSAGILSSHEKSVLIAKLKAHETNTSNQIVVVTLKDLGGYDIADYGYQLGRHWGIGQKGIDNGVLLILSKDDRKVRIEVGYGLEGVLPDARAHTIIQNDILPHFKKQKFFEGLERGVDSIISSINNEYTASTKSSRSGNIWESIVMFIMSISTIFILLGTHGIENELKKSLIGGSSMGLVVAIFTWIFSSYSIDRAWIGFAIGFLLFLILTRGDYGRSGSYSGGSSGSGGFSGGGGSFGGGGASGSW